MIIVYKYPNTNMPEWKRDYKSDMDKTDTRFLGKSARISSTHCLQKDHQPFINLSGDFQFQMQRFLPNG